MAPTVKLTGDDGTPYLLYPSTGAVFLVPCKTGDRSVCKLRKESTSGMQAEWCRPRGLQ